MKITYLAHSGFLVETGKHCLVFDYVQGDLEKALDGRKAVFFVSHSHGDHYSRRIFSLPHEKIFLSFEIRGGDETSVHVSPGEMLEYDGMKVRVFGSTDLGVSFLVEDHGETVFHAGDFNYWHWKEESTPQEVAEMKQLFDRELAPILRDSTHIQACFFPVDPRLGPDCGEGARLFAGEKHPDVLIPMHFLGMEELAAGYARELQDCVPVLILTKSMETALWP